MVRRLTFILLAAAGGWASLPSAAAAELPLNVVVILADDLGWRDLGCTGSTFYETPNLDALAKAGANFTEAYAACPVCSPTRAALMTGKYPARMATTDWFGAPQPDRMGNHPTKDAPLLPAPYTELLPLEEVTLAEAFKEAGYATFFAGKWHLGDEGYLPEDQGFDVNKGGHFRGSPPGGYFAPYKNPKLEDGPEGEHLPARLANETAAFIEAHRDDPFLAVLSFYSVHTPLQARADLTAKYEAKQATLPPGREIWGTEGARKVRQVQDHPVYAAMVEAMDAAVGRVLESLEENGLAERTLVVFTSDNGGVSTSEGHPTSNMPLRGGKGWLYEGGVRVPLLIRGPNIAKPGMQSATPVITNDLYPTLLEAAGLPLRPSQHVDGLSLAPMLRGGASLAARPLFWHYPHYGNQGGSPSAAVREGDLKLVYFYETGAFELYDLATDPSERHSLVDVQPEDAVHLVQELRAWQREVHAREPSPNPAAAGR